MSSTTARLAPWLEAEREHIVETLLAWVRIPSISRGTIHAPDVRRSAEFCAALLTDAGLENVEVLETGGAPAVYGDWLHAGPAAPTALVYGHHDVQPADPLELWKTPPFDPVVVDGECRGRGTIDDKGQVLYQVEAVRGLLATDGSLPVNVKFLIEGEEEAGSTNLPALLENERDRFRCDTVVVSDTTMWAADVPSVCVGMRGVTLFEVSLRTATGDLHSGIFGGAVPNAAHVAAALVAALHDEDGRVTVPGFYDDVRPLSPAEEASLAKVPFDEAGWMATAGVRCLEGEEGRTTLERVWTRPTGEVVGFRSGAVGEQLKAIVPATAEVAITFRLVPDQDPGKVEQGFRTWLAAQVPAGIDVEITGGGGVAPVLTPVEHPYMAALTAAIERVWGTAPLFTREGGSGPEEALARILKAPLLFLGVGLPDDRFHAPNERMVMNQLWKGLLAAGELWHELAAAHATRAPGG